MTEMEASRVLLTQVCALRDHSSSCTLVCVLFYVDVIFPENIYIKRKICFAKQKTGIL